MAHVSFAMFDELTGEGSIFEVSLIGQRLVLIEKEFDGCILRRQQIDCGDRDPQTVAYSSLAHFVKGGEEH